MRRTIRLGVGASGAMIGLAAWVVPSAAGAATPRWTDHGGAHNAVFVQTDDTAGNQIVAYSRRGNGTLTPAHTYNTGGRGGQLAGAVVDDLASQGSLTYDPVNDLLYAVNAGSNTVSVFSVAGDRLSLRQVVGSGGQFPVSVAVHENIVYVLNAENGGNVQGFLVYDGRLLRLPHSRRDLNLDPTATPQFVNTPGQVAFSPDGSQLIVTTKANGSDIDVFSVNPFGYLSASPVVNSEAGDVPFAVTFDGSGDLVVTDAGIDALSTYTLNANGTLTTLDTLGDGQTATCWVTQAQGYLYASNAGSADLAGYQDSTGGQLSLLSPNTSTDPGTVDSAASWNGDYLYAQTGGNGIVDEYSVATNGSLQEIGSVTVPDSAGGEGIVAF